MRNRRGFLVPAFSLASVVAFFTIGRIWIWPYGTTEISYESRAFPVLAPPSPLHPLGTTSLGQDVFVRIVDGFFSAVLVLALGSMAAVAFGIFLAFMAFVGGRFGDKLVSLTADALYAIPSILIALAAMIGIPSDNVNRFWIVIGATILGVALFFGAKFFRTLRVNIAREQQTGYYAAAVAVNLARPLIFFRHLLPNAFTGLRPIVTGAGSDGILTLAGLGFIGVGVSATDGADWGYDLSRGVSDLSQGVWWTTLFPALAISITVLTFALRLERARSDAEA